MHDRKGTMQDYLYGSLVRKADWHISNCVMVPEVSVSSTSNPIIDLLSGIQLEPTIENENG